MRGVYCIYGASLISAMAAILLIFVNISQLNAGPVTSGLYFVELNVKDFGAAFRIGAGGDDGVFTGDPNANIGESRGLRQYYRYGIYNACGYVGTQGTCNGTMFGAPYNPTGTIYADTTTDRGLKDAVYRLIGYDTAFSDANYNQIISRVGGLLIFVGSALCGLNIITGFFKARQTLLAAAILCGLSAFTLMIGASMWTAVIARTAQINGKMINNDNALGISVTTGSALYVTWAAFVFQVLATIPYVITGLTYSRKAFEYS